MPRIIISIFFILHAIVHLLYFAQSQRFFELQPGLDWPGGSWAFSKLLGDKTTRLLASICLILAAIAFLAGGVGLLLSQGWWRSLVIGAAAFSSLVFILFWNGKFNKLDAQGGVGLLIDLLILVALLVFNWPDFNFS